MPNILTIILLATTFFSQGFPQPQPVLTDNCLTLSSTQTCLQCVQGFYLQYFVCLPCAPLCQCSSQYNYCESCIVIQYDNKVYNLQPFLKTQNGRCYFCQNYLAFCIACTNQLYCTQCYGGYYIINITNHAGQLIGTQCSSDQCTINSKTGKSNCQICLSQNQCQNCQPGYFLNTKTNICSQQQCQPNCFECSDDKTCKRCMDQYYLDGAQCVFCNVTYCLQCSNSTNCTLCAPGYYASDGECTSTGFSNCVLYTGGAADASACQICQPNYFVLYGSCNQCIGCQLCSLQFLCQSQCFANATPFNYACLVSNTQNHLTLLLGVFLIFLLF